MQGCKEWSGCTGSLVVIMIKLALAGSSVLWHRLEKQLRTCWDAAAAGAGKGGKLQYVLGVAALVPQCLASSSARLHMLSDTV